MERLQIVLFVLVGLAVPGFLALKYFRAPGSTNTPASGDGKAQGTDAATRHETARSHPKGTPELEPVANDNKRSVGKSANPTTAAKLPPHMRYKSSEPVPAKASPEAASAYEALKTGKHPERLSVFVAPKPFDKEAFLRDPEAYCRVSEPGRAYWTAKPGPGVRVLRPVGSRFHRTRPLGEVKLAVKAAPKSLVAWTSMDMGVFKKSKTNSVCVVADKFGKAEVTYVAAQGVLNDVRILVGCPECTGQVEFMVVVEPEEKGPDR